MRTLWIGGIVLILMGGPWLAVAGEPLTPPYASWEAVTEQFTPSFGEQCDERTLAIAALDPLRRWSLIALGSAGSSVPHLVVMGALDSDTSLILVPGKTAKSPWAAVYGPIKDALFVTSGLCQTMENAKAFLQRASPRTPSL